ncbi:helix-turn-helix domain-containing protein [Nibricoccus aquaticus]|uniref:helix-turn-helix domain-containing protein n=1 Tax=Nibricoccus aquaticus TaxID=2576891 RepID=UPI001FE27B35|nr:helix-turn-helix domain-containing protein [Nibricoccus aquaticus]
METQTSSTVLNPNQLTDIAGLRSSGVFPQGKEPSIRTLRDWTKLRRIPHHRVGHFVYFDPAEVAEHIRTKLKVPARG